MSAADQPSRGGRWRRLLAGSPLRTGDTPDGGESLERLRADVRRLAEDAGAALDLVAAAQRRAEDALARSAARLRDRADLAAVPRARLRSHALVLGGTAVERLRIRRLVVGEPVERRFRDWMGVTRCAGAAPDVERLWAQLLAREAASDGVLRGAPATVLDVPDAVVSAAAPSPLCITPGASAAPSVPRVGRAVAVPRFSHGFPARKLRNFGHWLLDCLPQVAVLDAVAPDAVILVPPPIRPFYETTLALMGVAPDRIVPWDGAPVAAGRLLVLESDGRGGGGRPLSPLAGLRHRIGADRPRPDRGGRRLYISRRDARNKRRWVTSEVAIEQVFRSRGFETIGMDDCPVEEQARLFRDAAVVAGVSGAGLSDIVFAPPGTHVIVILSDALLRWYADDRGARSLWRGEASLRHQPLAGLGDSPRFYAYVAALCEQTCHSFLSADDVPLEALAGFLDDVLRQVP